MNNFLVFINGEKKKAVFPFKFGKFLDEQLDYATVTLRLDETPQYPPLSDVTVVMRSMNFEDKSIIQEQELHYYLADDQSIESPCDSGLYRHNLFLIEKTKYLEGFMVESLCVTNAGGRIYQKGKEAVITVSDSSGSDKTNTPNYPSFFTPQKPNSKIALPSPKSVVGLSFGDLNGMNTITRFFDPSSQIRIVTNAGTKTYSVDMNGNDNIEVELLQGVNTFRYMLSWTYTDTVAQFPNIRNGKLDFSFDIYALEQYLPLKQWTIKEVINRVLELAEPLVWDSKNQLYVKKPRFTFDADTIKNQTNGYRPTTSHPDGDTYILDYKRVFPGTINRITIDNLAELEAEGIEKTFEQINGNEFFVQLKSNRDNVILTVTVYYDDPASPFNQPSPEFTFTRGTLRETLQEIGGFIHAEPRLDEGNKIVFDFYGERAKATYRKDSVSPLEPLSNHAHVSKELVWQIEQACTRIDSYVDNLVNQLSEAGSTIAQPYMNGSEMLRTDSGYMRLEEDDNAVFPTAYPIYKIKTMYWVDVKGLAGAEGTKYDITNYLFEKTIYDSQLSSYNSVYPASKAYGLYYTQGEKNIGGFYFKTPNPVDDALSNYALTNILRSVTGISGLLPEQNGMCFELLYVPIYSARVGHGKQYIGDYISKRRAMAHNQSSNQVETKYYGENVKGLVERLGTPEKSFTFHTTDFTVIPKAGELWDDEFYISTVATEIDFEVYRCTVGLSKNFNRISRYIGANSYRRLFEVSERMVQERQSIYTDYVVIDDYTASVPPVINGNDLFCDTSMFLYSMRLLFTQTQPETSTENAPYWNKCTAAIVQGISKNGDKLPKVILPLVSSAFGNVIEFSWQFQDNFSAGRKLVYMPGGENLEAGYYTQDVPYSDYYGRMYYEDVSIVSTSESICDPAEFPSNPDEVNGEQGKSYKVFALPEEHYVVKRKDSREALKENYSVEFVTRTKSLIIGSGLAANHPTVVGINEKARPILVILEQPINKFARRIDLSEDNVNGKIFNKIVNANGFEVVSGGTAPLGIVCTGAKATAGGKAWAYVTPEWTGEPYQVEDEDGNVSTVTPIYGGELLFGKNESFGEGDTIGQFRMFAIHDIFDLK